MLAVHCGAQDGMVCPVIFLNESSRHPGPAGESGPSFFPNLQHRLVSKGCRETVALLYRLVQGRDQNVGPVAVAECVWPWGRLPWRA